jgi:hypothetical protein
MASGDGAGNAIRRSLPLEGKTGEIGWSLNAEDVREAFGGELVAAKGASQRRELLVYGRAGHDPARASRISGVNELAVEVEDDRDRRDAVALGPRYEGATGVARDVRRVDDRRPARRHPPIELAVEDRERELRGLLIGLVTGHDGAMRVGREDLIGREQTGGKRRLAGAGRADEDEEAGLRQREDKWVPRGRH